jgi:hypothetical protein
MSIKMSFEDACAVNADLDMDGFKAAVRQGKDAQRAFMEAHFARVFETTGWAKGELANEAERRTRAAFAAK